jgi:hypothetical protein
MQNFGEEILSAEQQWRLNLKKRQKTQLELTHGLQKALTLKLW